MKIYTYVLYMEHWDGTLKRIFSANKNDQKIKLLKRPKAKLKSCSFLVLLVLLYLNLAGL